MPAVFAVLAAAVLFGTTGTSQALGPDDSTPLAVGVARLLVGGTVLAVVGLAVGARARRRAPHPPPVTPRAVALLALTGVSLAAYQPLFFLGTERNGVAVGTVVALGSAPVLAGLFEWALTRRVPTLTWAGATALALAGVALLALGGSGQTGADPVGFAASVAAGATFAIIAVTQRRLFDSGWNPFSVAGGMGATAALIAVLCVPFVDLRWATTGSGLVMSLWLGLVTIAAAYTLFTWGLQRLTAGTAATLTLGEPLTAAVLGIAVLGERLSLPAVAGLVVLGAGLVLLAWGARSGRDRASHPERVRA
ncbi:EamA family transporter [Microbacterium lushaniae]|nr:EamA family transporter [Microbacterium lushaniae]KAA9159498.1 EamA family transporter [Microbacterium lushaniae]